MLVFAHPRQSEYGETAIESQVQTARLSIDVKLEEKNREKKNRKSRRNPSKRDPVTFVKVFRKRIACRALERHDNNTIPSPQKSQVFHWKIPDETSRSDCRHRAAATPRTTANDVKMRADNYPAAGRVVCIFCCYLFTLQNVFPHPTLPPAPSAPRVQYERE